MLTRTRDGWGAVGAALVLGLGALTAAPVAAAVEVDTRCDSIFTGGSECEVQATQPGVPGGTAPEGGTAPAQPVAGDPKRANFCEINTPGDQEWPAPYSCDANYDPVRQCVWQIMSPQPAPPAGKDATRGAWEQCGQDTQDPFTLEVKPAEVRWMDSTAAGATSEAQAARVVVARLPLEGIEIGMVPKPEAEDGVGAVGLPAWMWVKNTDDPAAWGPYTATEAVGGVEVTATATPLFITWDMGDGTQVVCHSSGTPYQRSYGREESPSCGHTYMEMSDPTYTVTAITTWSVQWTAEGESGVIETVTRSSQDVVIGELQAVNVKPNS